MKYSKLFAGYFVIGSGLGWVNAALMRSVAAGQATQAGFYDVILTSFGLLACNALVERRWAAVIGYVLGGGFGTWLLT